MGWKQDQIDKILDKYLEGELTEEEVRQMHETLENGGVITDSELDKIILPVDILHPNKKQDSTILQSNTTANIHSKLEEFKQFGHHRRHPSIETTKAYTLVFIIVFFTVIVMAPFVYMLLPISFNAEQLFKNNFSPYPIDKVKRDFNGNYEASSKWKKSKISYQDQNYHNTVHALSELLEDIENNESSHIDHFYIGVSYLAGNEPKAAVEHFESVLKADFIGDWRATTNWYLALTYLELNKTQETRKYLKEVIAVGNEAYNYEKALKLLEKL
ncbi:MAG: tetratricopeptide repeat protein [Chitinophagales bacterium]